MGPPMGLPMKTSYGMHQASHETSRYNLPISGRPMGVRPPMEISVRLPMEGDMLHGTIPRCTFVPMGLTIGPVGVLIGISIWYIVLPTGYIELPVGLRMRRPMGLVASHWKIHVKAHRSQQQLPWKVAPFHSTPQGIHPMTRPMGGDTPHETFDGMCMIPWGRLMGYSMGTPMGSCQGSHGIH